MKCYITGTAREHRQAIEALNEFLQIEWDENAIEIVSEQGSRIAVEFFDRKVKLTYPSLPGLFRALMLCRMEMEKGTYCSICEEVKIKNCGAMLDLSRNGVMTVAAMKKFAAQMAVMGLDQLYLYMEDTYTIEGCPYFGYMRGRYTYEELKEIDDFCAMIGIEAIPHIQVLGHMEQYIKWNEGMRLRDTESILIAGEDETYAFLDKAIFTVSSCFRTKKIHLGCDEAGALGSGAYYAKNGYRDRKEILLDHMVRVCKICGKYQLDPIIYGDILFAVAQGNNYAAAESSEMTDDFIMRLPKNLSIVFWDYDKTDQNYYANMLRAYKRLSAHVIFWGGIWTWFGFVADNDMTFDASTPALLACKENQIDTAVASIWGDDGCECSYFQAVFGLQLFAEHKFCAEVSKEQLKERFTFFTGGDYDVFMGMSAFHNTLTEEVKGLFYVHRYYGKRFVWSDIMLGLMDEELAERPMSQHYGELLKFIQQADNPKWNWLYRYFEQLCALTHDKCLIAEQLMPAYQANNRTLLAKIANKLLPALLLKVTELRNMHMKQWLSTYKPFGFEVLDIRYGGLANRIDYAAKRLNAYLQGEISEIDELEQQRLPHHCEWTQKDFSSIVTACYKI